jgi:hypothetical protein
MGLFSKILDKLGLNKNKEAEAAQAKALADMAKKEAEARAKLQAQAPKPATVTPAAPKPVAAPVVAPKPQAPVAVVPEETHAVLSKDAAPQAISEVDVVKHLEELSKGKGLDWKVSIVDLLKLLELDSSREARIELAKELGCPPELMGGDLVKMNVWLHKTVLKKIAENGGNIPKELLD